MSMRYPIGIQDFQKLRELGYAYVDKTALVYKLADSGNYYFLSRPRRFGKSLLLSTFEAYFSGRRDLFEGLAIESLEQKWAKHPILHLDLNTENYRERGSLERRLNNTLLLWEQTYGSFAGETSLALRFEGIVRRACEQAGERVVILVDEYDKPLLQTVDNPELQEEYRNALKAFYSVLKTQDRYIRFALLTGVTKFGKVSVFSDLNNLNDISMDRRYAALCGITEAEIHANFEQGLHELAEACGMTYDGACDKLRRMYDGYHFGHGTVGVYNPFSLLNTLDRQSFGSYWFETGTPTFLARLLQETDYRLDNLQQEQVSADLLGSVDSMSVNPVPVIYQSGYLTVKGYDEEFKAYTLGFPNDEVGEGFLKYLLPFYSSVGENKADFFIQNFVRDVRQGRPGSFMERLQAMLAGSDYRVAGDMEKYFQNVMYIVFRLMGFYVEVERATSRGRIDVVLQTRDNVYVMELKLDGSAAEALRQIGERGYAAPFAAGRRRVWRIGVAFSSATRGISEWLVE